MVQTTSALEVCATKSHIGTLYPANAPRAGRIRGLKDDIVRYRRKRRL